METYTAELLDETTGWYRIFNHPGPQPKNVQTLDPRAIKLLGVEKEYLVSVVDFFGAVLKKYTTADAEGESVEKKMLSNATLMKSLGRLVWKVAMALFTQKRQLASTVGVALVIGNDKEKQNLINKMMKGAFSLLEDRYVGHLESAGVFFQAAGKDQHRCTIGKRRSPWSKVPRLSATQGEVEERPCLGRPRGFAY